jgi:type I restriction enzyme, S subunit
MTHLAVDGALSGAPGAWRRSRFKAETQRLEDRRGARDLELLSLASAGYLSPRDQGQNRQRPAEGSIPRYLAVEAGDLVVNPMWLTGGSVAVSSMSGAVSPDYRVFRPGAAVVPRFLHHVLRSQPYMDQYRLYTRADTTFDRRVQQSDLDDLPLALPGVDEQRRIADFLDDQVSRIDQVAVLRRHQLELLSQRRRETIRVGVAGALHGQGVQTEVPWVPVLGPEAELRPLVRMVTLQRGVDLTADEREHGEYAVITSGGPSGFHTRAVVPHSGVVIGRYGSGGSVFWAEGPHWPHNTTLYVRDYKSNHLCWVFYLMQAYPYDALQARTAVPGVNRNDMARDLMPWLPPKRQFQAVAAIDKALAGIDTLAQELSRSVTLLNERMRALITAAVPGEFDVTTASGRGVA